MRTVKRIFPFIIVLAVLCSALTMIISAANTSTTKLATVIYKLDLSDNYYIEGSTYTPSGGSSGYYTYGSVDYLMYYLNINPNAVSMVFYLTENNQYKLLKANSTSQTYSVLTIDSDLDLKVIYRCYNGYFRFGFNKTTVTVDPEDYIGAARAFAYAYANRIGTGTSTKYATDMFAVSNSSTQIVNEAIVTGVIGDVYQGIISEDGYIHATNSRYTYSLVNGTLEVSFGIQSNLSGVEYNERGLFLHYMLTDQEITIPAVGSSQTYTYDFGQVQIFNNVQNNNEGSISFFIFFNGTQYANLNDPLHAFVTAILLQAFDVVEFNDTQFIWATKATIDQDIQISIYNGELVIINQLGHIISFIEDNTTVDLSVPGEDELLDMIETDSINQIINNYQSFDLSNYMGGMTALMYMSIPWTHNSFFKSVCALLITFFALIVVIRGLRR